MTDEKKKRQVEVKHRDDQYAERYRTSIWLEESEHENPFVETAAFCHGYSFEELVNKVSYPQMLFLLLKGELPSKTQEQLLNKALVAFCHPGVRHDAVRAAALAGVGKTLPQNILPIAMLVFGGSRTGSADVAKMMRYFAKTKRQSASEALAINPTPIVLGDYYGEADVMAAKIAQWLSQGDDDTPHINWGMKLVAEAQSENEKIGWTKASVAAAVFCDLGLMPKFGVALMQLLAAPGLLAQGVEHANKPVTVLPFVGDDDYEIQTEFAPS